MEKIVVRQSNPLTGKVKISGSKNSALPIIAACLLGTEPIVLEEVPKLKDVEIILKVLESLGTKIEYIDENVIKIDSSKINSYITTYDLMSKMRASFLVMGPLLSRFGKTQTFLPGGCAIGARPIDLHLKGFIALGAEIEENDSVESGRKSIIASAPKGISGNGIYLDFPSVGATQNIMMAATLAKGETVIENAAKEPEIVDLASFLNKMGARIMGAGTSTIRIKGVKKLGGANHTIIPDRIEAATFMVGAAITGGELIIENMITSHLTPVTAKLREMGCFIKESEEEDRIFISAKDKKLSATNIKTLPYPGFPTDVQAQFMTLMTVCNGNSKVVETVFENRFMHVAELQKMGALIVTEGKEAIIAGIPKLKGAKVVATDLRAGAALVLAGLIAEGETLVGDIYHIDRGYHDLVGKLKNLGANIERIND